MRAKQGEGITELGLEFELCHCTMCLSLDHFLRVQSCEMGFSPVCLTLLSFFLPLHRRKLQTEWKILNKGLYQKTKTKHFQGKSPNTH